jgi:hypothetical protein
MRIKATKEINEGSFNPIQPMVLLPPVIFAISMKITAGNAEIAAKIDNFSIVLFFN